MRINSTLFYLQLFWWLAVADFSFVGDAHQRTIFKTKLSFKAMYILSQKVMLSFEDIFCEKTIAPLMKARYKGQKSYIPFMMLYFLMSVASNKWGDKKGCSASSERYIPDVLCIADNAWVKDSTLFRAELTTNFSLKDNAIEVSGLKWLYKIFFIIIKW